MIKKTEATIKTGAVNNVAVVIVSTEFTPINASMKITKIYHTPDNNPAPIKYSSIQKIVRTRVKGKKRIRKILLENINHLTNKILLNF